MADRTFARTADDELIARAREGDRGAYGQLWVRHAPAAHAVSRSFTSLDADDVVAEAFARILAAVKKGGGPTTAFRPYLLTTVRNVAREWGTRAQLVDTTDLTEEAEDGAPDAAESAIAALEANETTKVFLSMPTRWQEALWYSEVEGLKPRQFAPLMGIAPNAASALVLRARRGFRDAWITTQLRNSASPTCQETLVLLGSHTRGALSRRDARRVDAHVADCASCALAWDEARDVSSRLALILLPAVIGTSGAVAYATRVHGGGAPAGAVARGAQASGGAARSELTRLVRRAPGLSAIGATTAGVAATGLIAVAMAFAMSPQAGPPIADGTSPHSLKGAPHESADGQPPSVASPQPDLDESSRDERDFALAPAPHPAPGPAPRAPDPGRPTPGSDPTPAPTSTPTPTLAPPTMTLDRSAGDAVYPLMWGVAEPKATVEIVDETGRVRASVPVSSTGAWSVEDLSGGACTTSADDYLGSGVHTVAARQRIDELISPLGSAQTIEIAPPPRIISPQEGSTVPAFGFDLVVHGSPGLYVQRIKLPDDSPCRTDEEAWMRLDWTGSFSRSYTVPRGEHVTIGARYIDMATRRHGPATFTTFLAE